MEQKFNVITVPLTLDNAVPPEEAVGKALASWRKRHPSAVITSHTATPLVTTESALGVDITITYTSAVLMVIFYTQTEDGGILLASR